MKTLNEKLAESLENLYKLQKIGKFAIRSKDLKRVDRERLVVNGFLSEVIQGWYISVNPKNRKCESTGWYMSFWN